MQHLAKCPALVGNIAIHSIELSMVPNVENVGAELHLEPFSKGSLFGEAHVPVIDPRTAADRTRSVANGSGLNGGISEQIWIEGITGNRLARWSRGVKGLCKRTGERPPYQAPPIEGLRKRDRYWHARRIYTARLAAQFASDAPARHTTSLT